MSGRRTNNSLSSLNEICLSSLEVSSSAVVSKKHTKKSSRFNVTTDKANEEVNSLNPNLVYNELKCQSSSTALEIEHSEHKSTPSRKKKTKEKKKNE